MWAHGVMRFSFNRAPLQGYNEATGLPTANGTPTIGNLEEVFWMWFAFSGHQAIGCLGVAPARV